jgi:oxygen-independent coproporphyrinogen-3 oxidase
MNSLIAKYAAPVPRYTSYPSAPHFSRDIGFEAYARWLGELKFGDPLSVYVHIPFCTELCWYCGCNTKATRRYEPIAEYIDVLLAEIDHVGARLATRRAVHMHWGGGSPNVLEPADIVRLADALKVWFTLQPGAQFAVEVDPRRMMPGQAAAFAQAGVNRVSIGVQDFDPAVQAAINRLQSFEVTKAAVDAFRAEGVNSVNLDLVYGLPNQTEESIVRTLDLALSLAPERIALFGYAHLPEKIKHQRLIADDVLPNTSQRYAQATRMADMLLAAGYLRVGLDHFVRPGDPLAHGPVHRNFQGYTSDDAPTLIGFGASAIGRIGDLGFVQNATAISSYETAVKETGFATVRGYALTADDRLRGYVIERLMCDLAFPSDVRQRFGAAADAVLDTARDVLACDEDGLLEPKADGFAVTERGRPFIRTICARFDSHFGTANARHSAGV